MTPDTSIIQQLVSGIGMPNFVVLIPEILVLITAFTIFILEMVSKNRKLITAISLTGLGLAALFTFVISSGIFYMLLNPNAIPEIRNSPF
jgi:NADH-quinone oxidoreductase subunit N